MQDEQKIFSTRDLTLATTLVCLGFENTGLSVQQEGVKQRMIGYWEFLQTPELQEAIRKYNSGLVRVEPREYQFSLTSLKASVTNMFANPNSEYYQKSKS